MEEKKKLSLLVIPIAFQKMAVQREIAKKMNAHTHAIRKHARAHTCIDDGGEIRERARERERGGEQHMIKLGRKGGIRTAQACL